MTHRRDPNISPLGFKVRNIRRSKGLSQQALADASGVSISIIGKLERGFKQDVNSQTLQRLASGLGCTATRLVNPPKNRPKDASKA